MVKRFLLTVLVVIGLTWFFSGKIMADTTWCGDFVSGNCINCKATSGCGACSDCDCGTTCSYGGGQDPPWTCFPAGIEVLMGDGEKKNIEEVMVGDKVVSEKETGERVLSQVVELDRPIRHEMCKLEFSSGKQLKLTDEHPLLTKQGWKAIDSEKTLQDNPDLLVEKMLAGDEVKRVNGDWDEIVNMGCWSEENQTYNLILDGGVNTYFADGFLAHNKGEQCPVGTTHTCYSPAQYTCKIIATILILSIHICHFVCHN